MTMTAGSPITDVGAIDVGTIDVGPITDDELAALALAADPDPEIAADAVPWNARDTAAGPLPDWYMPAPVTGRRGWKARTVAAIVILSFVVISASGFCITYGLLTIA